MTVPAKRTSARARESIGYVDDGLNVYSTAFSYALDSETGWTGNTFVQEFAAAALTLPSGTPSMIRFSCQAAAAEGFTISSMYVGHRAGSGDAFDFATTPVQVTFGGATSKVVAAGTSEVSDWIPFAYDKTSSLLIAIYSGGGSSSDQDKRKTGLSSNYYVHYKAGADDAATVNKTGYTSVSGNLDLINNIEMDGY